MRSVHREAVWKKRPFRARLCQTSERKRESEDVVLNRFRYKDRALKMEPDTRLSKAAAGRKYKDARHPGA